MRAVLPNRVARKGLRVALGDDYGHGSRSLNCLSITGREDEVAERI